ncbi:hypothetical protein GCM10027440_23770 [Nocardiopsis coralliicola]
MTHVQMPPPTRRAADAARTARPIGARRGAGRASDMRMYLVSLSRQGGIRTLGLHLLAGSCIAGDRTARPERRGAGGGSGEGGSVRTAQRTRAAGSSVACGSRTRFQRTPVFIGAISPVAAFTS